MELPKNLIQMGKPDRTHKIFVEDYIISYIKEWNRESDGQPAGIALYGQVYKESNYKYYFMYGASRIEGLDRRGPYLSQSDREEINNVGNRYFEEYSFLGWCIVREELPETIFLDTRGKAIEVNGYACFFEKNESMLNFMLEMDEREKRCARQAENNPENAVMDNAWADASKAAQDGQADDGQTETTAFQGEYSGNYRSLPLENRIAAAKKSSDKNAASEKTASYKEKNRQMIKHLERLKMAAAAMFTVLCVIGITTVNDSDKIEEMQVAARQVIADLSQQKIPDAENDNVLTANGSAHTAGSGATALTGGNGTTHTTGIDDGNTAGTATNGSALTGGNTATANGTTTGTNTTGTTGTTTGNSADGMPWPDVTPPDAFPTAGTTGVTDTTAGATGTKDTATGTTGTTQTATQPTSYTIMRGDTLNAICRRKYGDLGMVKQVCELNGIKNPNNIEVGQTILLP